jgi:hypothetical protein
LQIFHDGGIVDSSPPRDREDTGDFPATLFASMVQGTDSYLGNRPPTNSVVNLQLLMNECEGMSDSTTKDVFRCLEFLSMKQDTYLITPSRSLSARSGDGDLEVIDKSTTADQAGVLADTCDGPHYSISYMGRPFPNLTDRVVYKSLFAHAESTLFKIVDMGRWQA